jgi:putative nucleotidyltransferase with HDIG domain
MEKTGLLELLLQELTACRGVDQKGFHRFDVLDHSLLACDYAAKLNASREVRMASLFHDIGKPPVCKIDESGVRTFYRHDEVSASMARKIGLRFRYPNAVIDRMVHLIGEHMFHYEDSWTDAAIRRFIIRVGEENLDDIYALRQADAYATAGIEPEPGFLAPLISRVDAILAQGKALSLKDLAISGKDLLDLGVRRGPRLGIILNELLEAVLEDPELNSREKMLDIADKLNRRYGE